jgi:hypothetical protein
MAAYTAVEKYQYSGSFTKLPVYWYFSTQTQTVEKIAGLGAKGANAT